MIELENSSTDQTQEVNQIKGKKYNKKTSLKEQI